MPEQKLITVVQVGKNGLTEGIMTSIENAFKTHMNLKIQVLKSYASNKKVVVELSEKILEKLGKRYTARVLGHSIFIKKWRESRIKKFSEKTRAFLHD